MSKDRWNLQFKEFIEKLQFAVAIHRDPVGRRQFCTRFAKELAFVSLYLDTLDVTGGDAPFHFDPPQHYDFCDAAIEKHGFFVDGETKDGPWANMCPNCYADRGVGIGWGLGQLYRLGPSGTWRCIAGGNPRVDTSEERHFKEHTHNRIWHDEYTSKGTR